MKLITKLMALLLIFSLFVPTVLADTPSFRDNYNDNDIEIVNNIIENNGLPIPKWTGRGYPGLNTGWGVDKTDYHANVLWDESTPKRIVKLTLFEKNLSGVLDVSGLSALTDLLCYDNNLTGLVLGDMPQLYRIFASKNKIPSINLPDLPALKALILSDNLLTELDLSSLTTLEQVFCQNNAISSLDLTGQPNLTLLRCYSNSLTQLKINGLAKLETLECYENSLTELNLTDLSRLDTFFCSDNLLTQLDFTGLTSLMSINLHNNFLTQLNLKSIPKQYNLDCSNNELESLELHPNIKPKQIDIRNNYFTDESQITGVSIDWTNTTYYKFEPQRVKPAGGDPDKPIFYTISVETDDNGTAQASYIEAKAETIITLAATPNQNFDFDKWEILEGTLEITGNTFIMPAENVRIKATFIPIPLPVTYTLTVNNGSGSGTYEAGEIVEIAAKTAPQGQQFKAWISQDIVLTSPNDSLTTLTMPDYNVVIEATYESIYVPPVITEPEPEPEPPKPPTPPPLPLVATPTTQDQQKIYEVQATSGLAGSAQKAIKAGETQLELNLSESLPPEAEGLPVSLVIPKEILQTLSGLDLNFVTPYANLILPASLVDLLADSEEPFTITIEPSTLPQEALQLGNYDSLVAPPLEINTDLKGPVKVTLTCQIQLPLNETEREAYLANLYIKALHGLNDYEQIHDLDFEIDHENQILLSVTFTVNRFSTFALALQGQAPPPNYPVLSTKIAGLTYKIGNEAKVFNNLTSFRIKNNITLIAVRLLEDLGVQVNYQRENKIGKVSLSYNGNTLKLTVSSNIMMIESSGVIRTVELSQPVFVCSGRVYLPTRAISENLGFQVEWSEIDDVISIIPQYLK